MAIVRTALLRRGVRRYNQYSTEVADGLFADVEHGKVVSVGNAPREPVVFFRNGVLQGEGGSEIDKARIVVISLCVGIIVSLLRRRS